MPTRRIALLLTAFGIALTAPAAAQAAPNTATFTKTSDWGSGFVGNYVIRNGGTSSIVGWKLEFDLPPGERLTSAWSAKMSSVGSHYVLTDEDWTRTIGPGGSVQVGFQGEYLGSFGAPANCTLNGQPCGGGSAPPPPPPDTTPPSAPTGLAASNATTTSIDLRWSASTDNVGVTGYQVYSGATKIATVTGTSTTVTGLTAATSYTFTVKAVDAAGNASPASNAVTTSTASPPPPPPAGALTATFTKTSDWGNGFVAEYAIRNGGTSTVTGWKLEFDLPAGETITSAWSGKLSSSGSHYVLTDEDWTRTIAPGATVKVGFQGAYTGTFAAPTGCTINGQSCGGGPAPPPPAPDTTPPSAPANLAASSPTASTVDLRWSASTDNVGVTGYQVFSGTTKVATVTGTSTTVTGLSAATTYTFTVKAVDAAGNVSPASNAVSATTAAAGGGGGSGATAPGFAPYVDMTLNSDSLAATKSASGVKHFSLGFVVSGSACTASWGGYYGLDDPVIAQRIADLKAAGGDAIISFGGAAGQELARTCTSVSTLAAQYQAAIDRYAIRDLDFDIEGADQGDPASLDRRFKAIAQLQSAGQQAGKPVHVSLTLPVMPTGLTHDGLNVMRSAIANSVDVGVVNVMAMDYFDPSLEPYRMGDDAILAATSVHDQLAALYPSLSDAKLWAMVGVTPMLGINDDPKEIFTTADATKLTTFAKQKGLGRLAMWSINRDHPCGRPTTFTENTCSGVSDPDWAFSSAFRSFGT
jgi:chitodextrinase